MSTASLTSSSYAKDKELAIKKVRIPVSLLKTSRYQTRNAAFNDLEELENLANSIKNIGLLDPPRVRKHPEDTNCFEIISGHRRIHAVSKFLGWKEIECEIVENADEFDVLRLNVTENIQRCNLSPYEEGVAFLLCEKLFGFSDEEIAIRLHKSRQTVRSRQELAKAADRYLKYADSSTPNAFLRHFTTGHVEILSKVENANVIKHMVTMIARGGSVRHLRRFVELFAKENCNEKVAPDYQPNIPSKHRPKVTPVEEVLSLFEELKAEVPEKLIGRLKCLQDRYLDADLGVYRLSSDSNFSGTHKFKCRSCEESYDVERKLIPEEDKVLFIISPKNPHARLKEVIFPYPIFYKVKVDS